MTEDKRIALMIDSDNVSSKYIDNIFTELSKYGRVTIRRMYGDWSQNRLKSWLDYSAKYSLIPIMQQNDTPGKNASDIGLIIDAMDLLFSDQVDLFCIISSDGDFNRLAKRIRESGKSVIGMGEKKTPEAFRTSCERFIFLDIAESDKGETIDDSKGTEDESKEIAEIKNAILKMVSDNNVAGEKTGLGEIGSRLDKIFPDFDVRKYGYSKLSRFLKDMDGVAVEEIGNALWVSMQISSVEDIEKAILKIFKTSKTNAISIVKLKAKLAKEIPDLEASILQTGVADLTTLLKKQLQTVKVDNNRVLLVGK